MTKVRQYWRNWAKTGRRGSWPAGLLLRFTFTTWWEGKPCPCVVSLWELKRLTGPFNARPNATHWRESFHCSTEQDVHSVRSIDFHSWCDSVTITSLLQKSPVPELLTCYIYVCMCARAQVSEWVRTWLCVLAYVHNCEQRVGDTELQSYCWEHGCITQGCYGTVCESAGRQIDLLSQTLQGQSVLCSTSMAWQKKI